MIQIRSGVQDVMDRKKWEARGAAFVAKLKATKAVWFPPGPDSAGKSVAAATRKTTARTTKKATGTTKKTAGAAKKATGAGKKS